MPNTPKQEFFTKGELAQACVSTVANLRRLTPLLISASQMLDRAVTALEKTAKALETIAQLEREKRL